MGTFRDDPDFWRFHAEEVRIKSRQINDPGTKRAVQQIQANTSASRAALKSG
jgi:hypothetical protein